MKTCVYSWPAALLLSLIVAGCPHEDDEPTPIDDDDTADDDDDDTTSADDDDTSSADDDDPYIQPDVWVTPAEPTPGGAATVHYSGWLVGAPTITMRLGFNGYNMVEDLEDELEPHASNHNMNYTMDVALQQDTPDEYTATVELPSDGRAMHMSFFTGEEDDQTWDDNSGLHHHWAIEFPTIGPYLTWTDAVGPSDGVVVHFVTDVECLGTVELGLDATLGTVVLGSETSTAHHIPLTGLAPDTTYHYRVLDSAGRASSTYTFHTLPQDPSSYRFGVLSDMQGNGESRRWGEVAAVFHQSFPDAAFLLAPGDLTFNDEPGLWWVFFDRGGALLASTVILPVAGNHDVHVSKNGLSVDSFLRYFTLPPGGDGTYYRVDVGSAAFLGLYSEDLEAIADGGVQDLWLEAELLDLSTNFSGMWVFSFWHTSPYSAGDRHRDQMETVRALVRHVDGVVDWVFTGHDHLYQRTHPLRYEADLAPSGLYGTGPHQGVGYLVTPSAGAEPCTEVIPEGHPLDVFRDLVAYPEIAPGVTDAPSELGFVTVTLDGPSIQIDAWGMGTLDALETLHLVDTVSYVK